MAVCPSVNTWSPVSPLVLGLILFQAESSKSLAYSGANAPLAETVASFQRQSLTGMDFTDVWPTKVSGSWQLGSPLPTPSILPAPLSSKLSLFPAVGTMRQLSIAKHAAG